METLSIELASDQRALEIRTGEALPLHEPTPVALMGCTINAPFEWLLKRGDLVDKTKSHIVINRERMSIKLVINETDHYKTQIEGVLKISPEFKRMGINSYEYITPLEMSERIKMNRSLFENHSEAMELVTQLRQFRAKIDKDVERNIDLNKGDKRLSVVQSVESNVPKKFSLRMPLFVGMEKQTIEVETYFNPDDLTCCLVSPQACDEVELVKDHAINNQLGKMAEFTPQIAIIEQ